MADELVVPATTETALTLNQRRALLSFRERLAYDVLAANPTARRQISESLVAGMFKLFLAGTPIDEIARLNSPAVVLADVAFMRVDQRWDERRNAYREDLLAGVQDRMIQTRIEGVGFLSNQLTALHKARGERLQKFIQTGDTQYLDGLMIHSMRNYKEAMEMFMTITGQDTKKVSVSGEVEHNVNAGPSEPGATKKGLTAKQAAAIVAAMLQEDEPEPEKK